jgi:pimeloyl-ACP methyl ester carboxylesterase
MRVERAVFISPPSDPHELLRAFAVALGLDDQMLERVKQRIEARLGVPMEAMEVNAIAPSMQVPLLVIHDEDDKEIPVAVGRGVATAWPGAELLITRGLGHQRILRDEGVRDIVVRFVDRLERLQSAA